MTLDGTKPPYAIDTSAVSTRLIKQPTEREVLSSVNEVDARTALARGVAEYLRGQSIIAQGGREFRLLHTFLTSPAPEQQAVYPALTVLPEGDGTYRAKSLTPVLSENNRLPDGHWIWSPAEFTQAFVLELECNDEATRVGLTMLFEQAFNPVEWMYGFRLALPFYFGAIAHYSAESQAYAEDAQSIQERLRKTRFTVQASVATYRLLSFPLMDPQLKLTVQT